MALYAFLLIPNHILGSGRACPATTNIGSFKSAVSRRVGSAVWQRSYWERVIRNEDELNLIRHYVDDNPLRASCSCRITSTVVAGHARPTIHKNRSNT
ncbi:MAG: hypothetical protein JWO48_3713 [Bryobacterales bacterium]|nr:hypothetical protein [Bryobacterales bacterium]